MSATPKGKYVCYAMPLINLVLALQSTLPIQSTEEHLEYASPQASGVILKPAVKRLWFSSGKLYMSAARSLIRNLCYKMDWRISPSHRMAAPLLAAARGLAR